VLNEFQIELEILDKFIIDGCMTKRGLFSFVANGTYERFELTYYQLHADYSLPSTSITSQADNKTNEDDSDALESSGGLKSLVKTTAEIASTAATFFPHPVTSAISGALNAADSVMDSSEKLISAVGDIRMKTPLPNRATSQFKDLKFSDEDGIDFESIHKEIKQDALEYLEVLKNSVFYGSGILRFFKQGNRLS
jgi:hypothetical protein